MYRVHDFSAYQKAWQSAVALTTIEDTHVIGVMCLVHDFSLAWWIGSMTLSSRHVPNPHLPSRGSGTWIRNNIFDISFVPILFWTLYLKITLLKEILFSNSSPLYISFLTFSQKFPSISHCFLFPEVSPLSIISALY